MTRNKSTSGRMSRNFKVGIRTWCRIEDVTGLREQIVDILLDLMRKIEILAINNQVVAGLDHKEKNNDEKN